ncbi:MAG: acyl carrier protein [Candidatus Margulisiibacteriota bacterium]|nr:acyl carrier protein [Candidatus Margulisiibacteriota bacterium]
MANVKCEEKAMGEELKKEIRATVSKVIKMPEEKIGDDTDLFSELGVDSLLGVEILANLDKKYKLDIPENRLKKIRTLNNIVEVVNDLLEKREYP